MTFMQIKTLLTNVLLLGLATLVGCNESHERRSCCTLDKLNTHGNVTKIETIVQSTTPLTELSCETVPIERAITLYGGNFTLEINEKADRFRDDFLKAIESFVLKKS